jgi:NitT/TauT family transport system ATP-binding protein
MTSPSKHGPEGLGLRISRVSKVFPTATGSFTALDGINLEAPPGLFVGLVGPSGCGKSTLLKLISGLESPTTGEVLLDGSRIDGPRTEVGLMFQTAELFPWRTVEANIALPLEIRKIDKSRWSGPLDTVLRLVRLEEFRHHYPHQLSGGMQQRVALCRLLVSDPSLMLLDEPFASLDEFTRERLNNELARITEHEHKTTVFVTHNITEAAFLSDRVAVMGVNPGSILEVVDVPLPRPRLPELRASAEFNAVVNQIRKILNLN